MLRYLKMPYVSSGYLKINGEIVPPGTVVPAEKWPTRRSLLSQGRIKLVNDEDVAVTVEEIESLPKKPPPGMDAEQLKQAIKGPSKAPYPSEFPVRKLMEIVPGINDAEIIKEMLEIEGKEKKRKTVIRLLKERITSLEE